jgi:hypothetical protein
MHLHGLIVRHLVMASLLFVFFLLPRSSYGELDSASYALTRGVSARIATLPPPSIGTRETYFLNIRDRDVITSPFRVIFGATGVGIAPAGVDEANTGHHHLLIDTALPLDLSKPIPFSDKYVHFGNGQTEAILNLAPGYHTLQLLFADHAHKPLFKTESGSEIVLYSRKITVLVEAPQPKSPSH